MKTTSTKTTVLCEQLQQYGVHTLSTEELLTLIFCTKASSGRAEVLKQVQNLFGEYGSLQDVINAEFGEICLAQGFGEQKATQLQAVLEIAKRLAAQQPTQKPQIRTAADAVALVQMDMMLLDHEQLRVLVLNTRNQVIANLCLYQGTVNSSVLRASEVFRPAITRKAPGIILCHNHPSGDPTPSSEDMDITRQLAQAGQLLDVELLDHLIIGNPRYVSLKTLMGW